SDRCDRGRALPPGLPLAARRRRCAGAVRVRGRLSLARAHHRAPRTPARRPRRRVRWRADNRRSGVTAPNSRRGVRATQTGLLVLLFVCAAQLTYWMIDESRYTATVRDELHAALEHQPGITPAAL